jgi:hypothetical protein
LPPVLTPPFNTSCRRHRPRWSWKACALVPPPTIITVLLLRRRLC